MGNDAEIREQIIENVWSSYKSKPKNVKKKKNQEQKQMMAKLMMLINISKKKNSKKLIKI